MSFLSLVFRNLIRQRVRTLLTILGISIGITTVFTLGVITEGMKSMLGEMMVTGGADFLVAQKGSADFTFSTVTEDEWQAIAGRDDVLWAHGMLLHVVRAGSNPFFALTGVRPDDLAEAPPEMVAGTLLPAGDQTAVVLGAGAASDLGAGVGDTVELGGGSFHVVGVYRTGATFQDSGAYADLEVIQELAAKPGIVTGVYVKVAPGESASSVGAAIEASSGQVTVISEVGDFGEVDQGAKMIDAANLAISVLAVGIGAIGVMNTMIMSVFERTREIGILRAVGWSGRRIVRMILAESALLCLVAAVVGMALGLLATRGVMSIEAISAFLTPSYTVDVVLRALLVAGIVAIVGAIYPVIRAVRLTPMEALRHE